MHPIETLNHYHHWHYTYSQCDFDLKGGKKHLCPVFIIQICDTVGELSNRTGGPLVNVLLHGLEVIPKDYAIFQSLSVSLYSLRGLQNQERFRIITTVFMLCFSCNNGWDDFLRRKGNHLIGLTDAGMRHKREQKRKLHNVSRLVYISVSVVTAEQPTKSHWEKKGGESRHNYH